MFFSLAFEIFFFLFFSLPFFVSFFLLLLIFFNPYFSYYLFSCCFFPYFKNCFSPCLSSSLSPCYFFFLFMFASTFNLEQERGLENVCVCNFGLKQSHNSTWRWVWNNKKSCYKNTTKFVSFLSKFFCFLFLGFFFSMDCFPLLFFGTYIYINSIRFSVFFMFVPFFGLFFCFTMSFILVFFSLCFIFFIF